MGNDTGARTYRGAPPTDQIVSGTCILAKIGPDHDIPHITPAMIVKYATDLKLLGLLDS